VGWRVEQGVDEGRTVAHGTHGHESAREDAKPLSLIQKWHWGSCTKALTATVVAGLVDQGVFKSGWETQMGDLFSDLGGAADARFRSVTLRQLAAHRSGLQTDLEPAEEEALKVGEGSAAASTPPALRAAFLRKLAEKPLECEPGERFGYSNAGYAALSAAAEVAAGEEAISRATRHG